ncbi:plasma protease C1 inhibitor [Bombina bombina]|uniref:plasma protease C1 inhibitor n=1 Tax=Bombina bombina TaxID=8345 RepID=UPI00235AEB41|nr:plasma protease C1 inhibitor [Bombina bombina]
MMQPLTFSLFLFFIHALVASTAKGGDEAVIGPQSVESTSAPEVFHEAIQCPTLSITPTSNTETNAKKDIKNTEKEILSSKEGAHGTPTFMEETKVNSKVEVKETTKEKDDTETKNVTFHKEEKDCSLVVTSEINRFEDLGNNETAKEIHNTTHANVNKDESVIARDDECKIRKVGETTAKETNSKEIEGIRPIDKDDILGDTEVKTDSVNENMETETSTPYTSTPNTSTPYSEKDLQVSPTPPACPQWPECTAHSLKNASTEIVQALTTFSLNMYKELSKSDNQPNIVISPLSVALTLSHLLLGTGRLTRDAMLKTLYEGLTNNECVHELIRKMTKYESFLSASQIFYAKGLSLNPEFLDQSNRFYGSRGMPLGEKNKSNLKIINKWVSEKTNNNIQNLLNELPKDFQLLLLNVIFYQGKWLSLFNKAHTRKDIFFRSSLDPVKVLMMNSHKYPVQVFRDRHLEAQVARFPLTHNISLLFFLPFSSDPKALTNVVGRLNQEVLHILVQQLIEMPAKPMAVSIPHLKLKSQHKLNNVLSVMGFYDLFSSPDLCALSNQTDIVVDDVIQHAVLEVKEEGVTAAAATSISLARTVSTFSLQKPFFFILASDISGMPLLLGRVTDPNKT